MVTLQLHVENIAGDWFGWIEDFPGAYASGETSLEVERSAPRAFAEYLKWLREHGSPLPNHLWDTTSADFLPTLANTHPNPVDSPEEARHFMASDGKPLRAHEFQHYMNLLRYSRADLVDAAGAFPPHEWDTAPLGGQSIRAHLQRLADSEAAMLGRIGRVPSVPSHPDPLSKLARTRAMFETAITALYTEGHEITVASNGVRWSLSKVVRLSVWHERHIADRIAARSNPSKYLKSVRRSESLVGGRDVTSRHQEADDSTGENSFARHTHASAYYY